MSVKQWLLAGAALAVLSTTAEAQWQNGDIALRTNGNLFRSGDSLRVELLALGPLFGPFSAEVRYRFLEETTVVDNDGNRTVQARERLVSRPVSPPIERMDAYQRLLLDDTVHFGQESPEGCFRIETVLFFAGDARPVTTLGTCACLGESRKLPVGCSPYLRGLKEARLDEWLVFDGRFADDGLYSLVLLSEERVLLHIPPGATTSAPDEMQVLGTALRRARGRAVDLLVHDHRRERSSTLGRITLPLVSP